MKITAHKREIQGKKVKTLRNQNLLPASIYGPKREPMMLVLDPKEFEEVFKKAGTNQLVTLEIEAEGYRAPVLIKEVQEDFLKQEYIHVSFYEIDPTSKIVTQVPVLFEGVSPAVKNNLGFLVTPINEVEVRCLPKDIPTNFVVDISNLKEVGDNIMLSDIKVPEGVELVDIEVTSTAIAYIAPPQKEIIEEEVVEEEVEGAESEEVADEEVPVEE